MVWYEKSADLPKRREDLDTSFQNSLHIGNCSSVIGNRNIGIFCTFQAIFHLPFIERTAAAVNDHLIAIQFQREFRSAGEFKIQLFSGIIPNPARKLDRADIITLSVVRAAFRDQDGITIFQCVQGTGAVYDRAEISLISGEKNGK